LAAMHLLQKISSNGSGSYPAEIFVEPELVVRESTFAPQRAIVDGESRRRKASSVASRSKRKKK
jgi:hypothetical protein